jgi:predicted RNA methylase
LITLQQFREQNPQYADTDSVELAAKIYKSTPSIQSSDVSFEEFADIFGVEDDMIARDPVKIGDFGRSIAISIDSAGQLLGRGMQAVGLDRAGEYVEGIYKNREVGAREGQSYGYKAAMQKQFLEHDEEGNVTGPGPALTSPTKIVGSILESSAPMALGMGAGYGITKSLLKMGMSEGLAGIIGGAIGEGSVAGGQSASDAYDIVMGAPLEQLASTDDYQQALSELKDNDYGGNDIYKAARERVARKAAVKTGLIVAGTTAVFGSPSGAAMGKVFKAGGKNRATTFLRQGIHEAAQEAPQSASETYQQNKVIQKYSDPTIDPMQNVAESSVEGAITGAAMGGAMGTGFHHQAAPIEDPPPYTGFKSQPRREHLALGGYTTPDGPPPVGPASTPQQVQNQAIINEQMPDSRYQYPFENISFPQQSNEEQAAMEADVMRQRAERDAELERQRREQPLFPPQSQEEQAAMEADIVGQRNAVHQQAMQKKHPHLAQKNATDFDNKVNSVAAALRAYLGDKAPQPIGQAETPYSKMVNASLKRKKSLNPEVSQPPVRSVQPDMGDFKPVSQYRGEEKDKKLKVTPSQLPDRSVKPDMSFASHRTETDIKAHEAATSPENDRPEPTEGQIDAGNYKKGHVEIDGMKISIENPLGSKRKGKDKDGKEWSTDMQHHYGYVRGTVGKDKDHLDTFVKPGTESSPKVFVIDQVDPKTGKFDEHKVMIGFNNKLEAGAAYKANYEKGWKGGSGITEMSMDDFKKWAFDGKRKTKRLSKQEPKFVEEYKQAAEKGVEEIRAGEKHPERFSQELVGLGIPGAAAVKTSRLIDKALNDAESAKALLHPDNKNSRNIWERETNVKLPKTVTGTNQAISEYFNEPGSEPKPKKLTKKEKALEDYRKFLAGLSEDEVLKIGDLIEDEPKSPAGQILKMKKALSAKQATNVPEAPREIQEKNSGQEQPVKKLKTYIGKNHKGAEVYEDGNGNRFHSEGDMLVGSPVGIIPGKGLDIKSPERLYADGAKDFLTVDEVKKFDDDKVKSVLDNSELSQRRREQEAAAQEKAEKKAPSKKVVLNESGFTKRINRIGAATAPDGTDYSIQKDDAGYYIRTTKDGNRVEGQERFDGFPQASGEAVSRAFGKKEVAKPKKEETVSIDTEKTETPFGTLDEAKKFLIDLKNQEKDQGRVVDAGLLTKIGQVERAIAEAEKTEETIDYAKEWDHELTTKGRYDLSRFVGFNDKDSKRFNKMRWANLTPEFKDVLKKHRSTWIGQDEKSFRSEVPEQETKPEYGNKNKIFTKDAADKARELLKKKLSGTQLNTGLDPEIIQAGIQLAGYHIEAGARSFAEYSKAMIADIGEAIKPYLRSFYEGVRYYPGFDSKGMDSAENIDKGKDADPSVTPHVKLASWVSDQLTKKQSISSKELFEQADSAYGGTQGGNAYTVKDAYDAMELGINKFIENKGYSPNVDVEEAITNVNSLNSYTKLLATQTKRTKEQNEFQQFSTPPAFAYIANWIADINKNDTVLEPSAGIGGLAVFAKNAGANVYVNEFSERRAEFLNEMGFNRVFTEDAAQLNNILPADVKPTVVIMNPPFSSTAGRTKKNSTMNGAKHIEQALERLQDNGRLVAIVGQGMSMDASMFKNWWDGIKEKYNVRANIGVSGKEYAKYGTTFDNQLIVIDKTGKTGNTLTGKVDSFSDLIPVLEDLKKEGRYAATETSTSNESNKSGQPDVEKSPDVNKGTGGKPQALRPSTDGMGDKNERGTDKRDAEYSNVDTGKNEPEESNVSVEPEKFTGTPVRAGSEPDTGTRSLDTGRSAGLPSRDKTPPKSNVKEISDSVYDSYIPNVKLSGSKKHITPLVESAAMADTKPPKTDYTPNIPNESIKSGNLTDAQLEAIIFAGTAHSKFLGDGSRKGFFIGDGTGVGKGREIAGIIWDNWRNGNKKAIWLSEKASLLNDAKRDLNGIGFSQGADSVFSINSTKLGESIKQKEGILFTQYATLRGRFNDIRLDKEKTLEDLNIRLNQIVKWAGKDFDGVIAFDEAHNMGNVIPIKGKRGTKKPANQALAGVLLQKMLPKAKVVYASATGATEVSNLAYATRLGLWGEGTPFKNTLDFVTKIAGSGISAMELVARDMKSLGLYIARSLSYADVKYDRLEHELSPEQTKIYDTLAKGWQKVLENIHAAIEETEGRNSARSAALSQFWGAHQRFFNQIITAMQMPTALKQMEKDIDAGHSVVVQLVSTNAEQTERKLAELDEDMEIEDLDMTPRESLMQFLERSFPTQQYEEYEDENGDIRTRPVFDSAGNPVQNQKAVELKQRLLQEMGSMSVPETALDMILQKFGNDTVAEVTGRKRRIIIGEDGKKAIENWSDAKAQKDIRDYMDDKKRILIFSEKGGTGSSYHAALDAKNQRLRRHYLIQPGWRADKAVQGLGRSHRSFQKQAPEFVLVTTNLPGQKRFLSSIARRLDQLGALTKGQRQTGGQGIFAAKDNLESTHAKDALKNFFDNLTRNRYDDLDVSDFERQTGLSLFDSKGNLKDYPEMSQFLNRILSMTQDMQNKVFDKFSDELDRVVQIHSDLGTLDVGLETITAQAIRKTKEEVAYKDEKENIEAKYVQFELDYPAVKVNFDQASSFSKSPKFYVNKKSGKIRVAGDELERTDPDTGAIKKYHYLRNPKNNFAKVDIEDIAEKWEKVSKEKAQTIWNEEYSNLPDIATEKMHLLTGTLLPLWDRLKGRLSVARLQTDDGERYLGRKVDSESINDVLSNLGMGREKIEMDGGKIADNVLAGGSVKLSNETQFKKSRVAGEDRIEYITTEEWGTLDANQMEGYGLFSEIIQWKTRWFVPSGDNAGKVIDKILKGKDIVSAQTAVRKQNVSKEPLYSTNDLPGQGIDIDDIKKQFKGQDVFVGPDGNVSVRFKNGQGVIIQSVKRISDQDYEFALRTGRMKEDGIILGKYQDQTITFSRDYASVFTLRHETVHLLEDLGVINKAETISLIGQAKRLKKQGKLNFKWNDKNMAENRANLLAQVLGEREAYRDHWLDKIIQRVVDFFDGLWHIGRASVRKLARAMESGEVYSRNVDGVDKPSERGKTQLMTSQKGKGDIPTGKTSDKPDGGESWKDTSRWDVPGFEPDPQKPLFDFIKAETDEESIERQVYQYQKDRLKKYIPPPFNKGLMTPENVDEISTALIAAKQGKITSQELSNVIYQNIPIPNEDEHGSGMVGDIYIGSVKDNILDSMSVYLYGTPSRHPDTNKIERWPKKTFDEYLKTEGVTINGKNIGSKNVNLYREFRSEEAVKAWWEKHRTGKIKKMEEHGPAPFSGFFKDNPYLWDVLIKRFRNNPTKILRDVLNDISVRVGEDKASMELFLDYYGAEGEFNPDAIARRNAEAIEERRKSFKLIKNDKPSPIQSPQDSVENDGGWKNKIKYLEDTSQDISGFGKSLKKASYSGELFHSATLDGLDELLHSGNYGTINTFTENSTDIFGREITVRFLPKYREGLYTPYDADAGKNYGYDEFRVDVNDVIKDIDAVYLNDRLFKIWESDESNLNEAELDELDMLYGLAEDFQIRYRSEKELPFFSQSRTPDKGVQKRSTSSPQFSTTDDIDSTGNPDFDTNVKTWKGIIPGLKNVFIKRKDTGKNYKPDLNFVETTFGLLSHNADKIEGLKRFFNELIRRPEYKHRKSEELSKIGKMSLVGALEDLQKHNKDSYNQLREYLLDRDVNQIGTLVKETETGWGVQSEKKNGKRTVLNDGIEFPSKEEAREWAIDYEVENYKDPEGRESLRAFRNLTAKLHDYYAGTWQEVIKEYEKRGLALPQVVQKTSTGENRIDLKVALAKMGERSSYYFPRQRSNGEWKVIGKKADGTTYIDYRDNRLTANMLAGRLQDQGYQVEPIEKVGKLSEDIFQSIESVLAMQATVNQALAETKLEEKLRGLEDFGLKAYWEDDTLIIQNGDAYRWSADVLNQLGGEAYSHLGPAGSSYNPNFRFKNASEDMAEIVTNALLHAKGVDQDISFTLAKAMAEQLADILRSRGSQARMIARMDAVGKEVPVGFETDPLKAIAQAVNSAAGGYAKRELALKATKAITGRLQNWEEFQESHQDYDLLNQLEQEREGLSANTESEKARIRKLEDQLKKLQQERVGTTTETEKGKRTRLLNISNIHDELNRIRVWTDPSKAANLQKKITRIRSNMHKDYQTSINDNRIDPKRQKNAYNDAVSALKNVLRNEEASDRVIKTVRGLTSLWFLGGRVSSAIVNLTSMGTSVPASMNAYGEIDFKKIPALIGKASKAYASFVMGKGHVSAEDRAILEEIDSRGWVAAQLNMEVVNAIKSGSAQKYSRFTEIMMTPFKITEEFNRAVTILAAYNGIRVNNPEMSVEDALQKAKTVSDRAHGIYGEENTPALLRKGEGLHAVSSMYIFQTYLHNYYNTMAQMFGRKQAKAFIYMGLSGAVFGGISSAPIIAAAMMLLKALDVDEPEEEIYAMAEEIFGESGSDVARFGLPGLAGISLKGSLAPNLPDFEEPIDILGPIGGMMRNWWDGAVNITKGDYLKGAEKLLPLAAGNVVKGYRETTQGVTTRAGDPVFFGKEQIKGDVGTGVTRALGFNPTKIAKPREIQWSETTLSNKYAEDKREIYSQIVRYFGQEPEDRDPDDWKDIVLEARKFNAKVKSHGIERLVPLISSKSIKDRLKRSSRPTKRERLRGEEQESNTMVDLPEDSETMVHNVWFSETYGELNKLAKNIRNYQQSGDLKKAAKLARENVDKIKLRKLFKEVDKDVRKINKAIKLVNLSKLDQETKKKRIDVLTKLKNDKVRKVYRLVHDKMKSTVRG